mmetsp:Transcript_14952/g.45725  ORF Transcript_14952/g.45725 Transcript_14952/m.45725 type:complete len:317 (-) Transcript_14952:141-1091(-)
MSQSGFKRGLAEVIDLVDANDVSPRATPRLLSPSVSIPPELVYEDLDAKQEADGHPHQHQVVHDLTSDRSAPRRAASNTLRPTASGEVQEVVLPGGVLHFPPPATAIVQQCNCVGCDCRGLAQAIAEQLPYGCPYKARQRMPPLNRFAVPNDRPSPGTISVHWPPAPGTGPIVINFFSQWEMGPALKYNRVSAPAGVQDSAEQREVWFKECLNALGEHEHLPDSVAFPHQIGCGLAGGSWNAYERMIRQFASRNPQVTVRIVRMPDWQAPSAYRGGGGRGRGQRAAGGGRGRSSGGRKLLGGRSVDIADMMRRGSS